MKSLLDQLPALLGVIVGALGAMTSSTVTDRLRWRRDQAVQWDQRRLDAYIAFASSLKDSVPIAFRMTAPHRGSKGEQPIDRDTTVAGLEEAARRNSKDWQLLLFVADANAVDAARRWRYATWAVVRAALAETWDADRWTAAVHELDRARDDFHAVTRQGLGVPGSVDQFLFQRELHGDAPTPPASTPTAHSPHL